MIESFARGILRFWMILAANYINSSVGYLLPHGRSKSSLVTVDVPSLIAELSQNAKNPFNYLGTAPE